MHILLPGPTPVPGPVEKAMLSAMSDHRGTLFASVHRAVQAKLSDLFRAPSAQHVAVLPASGTGALEAAAQNLFLPGDRVLLVETGLFGQRFGEVAAAQGITVDRVSVPWGQAFDADSIVEQTDRTPYRGVLVTHNETSTGVLNPVEALAAKLDQIHPRPLLVVDSISGVPSVPLSVDRGVDVIIAGSQKGFMCPPGLAILAFSANGKGTILNDRPGRFYFNLVPYLEGRLPYTPAVSLWYGLDAALDLLAEEGAGPRLARHQLLRDVVRAFAEAGGLTPLVDQRWASPTVTALGLPDTIRPADLRQRLEEKGLQIAGGLGPWHDQSIRIGHVGALDLGDLWAGLGLLAPELPNPSAALLAASGTAKDHQGGI